MIILETLLIAFSMFSAIPVPQVQWNARNMRFTLCAFPLVGALIGLACVLWVRLCAWMHLPSLLQGAGLCLLPVMLSGGIHLDGYADTWDALASHSDVETRQKILKDPHMGAFAAIRLCMFFLAYFALWVVLPSFPAVAVVCSFCLSRTLSALAVAAFPLRSGAGLARSFADASDKRTVRIFSTVLSAALCAVIAASGGIWMVPAALVVFVVYRYRIVPKFNGLSGDLAGWFVQTAELWMLAALCFGQYAQAML